MKRFLSLAVLIAMLWGCGSVEDTSTTGSVEDTPATEEKTASYKVEHYQQNIDNVEYTLVEADTETKTGTTDEETSEEAKTYEGFTAKTVEQVEIAADGSSVVKIYYDRKMITLTLTPVKYGKEEKITGKYGATVNVLDPTRDNYRFEGWDPPLPDTIPAEDNKYVGKWVKILSVKYDLNGGKWIDGFTPKEKWDRGEDIYLPTAEKIEKAGYDFAGWLRGKRIITEILDSTSDVTVTAQWLEIYAITYDLDGGTNAESNPKEYTKKSETITLADATKTGYTFGGWYTDKAFTEESKVTQIEKGSTGNITLYAQWTANKAGISVMLPEYNDAQINLQQVTNENTVTFTAADGFDSYAWYIDGVRQSETTATYIIDTSTMNPANYKIMVVVSDGGEYYCATADLEVKKLKEAENEKSN